MSKAELSAREHGRLANNHMAVLSLQSTLSSTEGSMSTLPRVLLRVIKSGAWQDWVCQEGKFHWNAADFREFLRSPRPAGCQSSEAIVRKAIKGTEAEEIFEEVVRGKPGGNNNPYGRAGKPDERINRDIITVDSSQEEPVSIPLPGTRDHQREAPTGTSTSYALRRLGVNRPDLLERVKVGDLSPNAAMIEAGFAKRKITIPADPEGAARVLVNRFKGADLDDLVRRLASWAQIELKEGE